jgi:Holliday junction resolvase RusA-like endonuclease
MRIPIKPLSVNDAWQGRRFKTDAYKGYERLFLLLLKPFKMPHGLLQINLTFGFCSKTADIDNPIKCVLDILQKKYLFNDNTIYRLVVEKKIVKQGEEYVDIEILKYEEN